MAKHKGNGHPAERRTGFERRLVNDRAYAGAERRRSGPRRKTDRAADKPIKR